MKFGGVISLCLKKWENLFCKIVGGKLRMATTQVMGRRRGATLILPTLPGWALKGMAPYNEGSFTVQESKEDLTRDHYLSSSPIDQSLN